VWRTLFDTSINTLQRPQSNADEKHSESVPVVALADKNIFNDFVIDLSITADQHFDQERDQIGSKANLLIGFWFCFWLSQYKSLVYGSGF